MVELASTPAACTTALCIVQDQMRKSWYCKIGWTVCYMEEQQPARQQWYMYQQITVSLLEEYIWHGCVLNYSVCRCGFI